MWTRETRAEHDRDDLRYPSDLTDAEWQILEPLLPPPAETGRHRSWPMRELMNAIFLVLRGGCAWRMLPDHFPPHQTTYRWFTRFRDDGTWESLNHQLVMLDRERVAARPTPAPRSLAAKASKPLKRVVRGDTMPARKSTGASVMPWLIPMAEG